jgi:hypothetical protein
MDMIRWPYDEHVCQLKIGSWTYHGKEIDLEIGSRVATDPVRISTHLKCKGLIFIAIFPCWSIESCN